jgi:hypothetical protein
MSTDRADPFDLDALRPGPEIQKLARVAGRPPAPARPRKWRRQFIRFPWAWMDALKAADRSQTYRLALLLVYEHWRAGGRDIVLSNVALEREGISRWSKWRALGDLEKLGLVRVERRHRKAPRIVVLIESHGESS